MESLKGMMWYISNKGNEFTFDWSRFKSVDEMEKMYHLIDSMNPEVWETMRWIPPHMNVEDEIEFMRDYCPVIYRRGDYICTPVKRGDFGRRL